MKLPLSKFSFIGGIIGGIAGGVMAIVAAVLFKHVVFAFFGAAAIIGTLICAFTAEEGNPTGNTDPRAGGSFKKISDPGIYALFGLFGVAIVLSIIFFKR